MVLSGTCYPDTCQLALTQIYSIYMDRQQEKHIGGEHTSFENVSTDNVKVGKL